MIVFLLFLVPLAAGIVAFLLKDEKLVRGWALLASVATLALALAGNATVRAGDEIVFHASWMGSLGSSFSLQLDGLSGLLTLLTAIAYPLILLATWKSSYTRPHNFFALMLLTQAGLMGVFTAADALLFYFFWELALIPVYFLCSGWGGERRIQATFKFFIYTFTASVLMLVGLLYLYFLTPDRSFSMQSFYNLQLTASQQGIAFWLLFLAFAVKMPVFPFHTWQPDTYEQSPTAATMVLSGLMVKMGVFGIIRWVLPVVSTAAYQWGDVAMSLGVIGIIYASLIAMQQDDLRRFIAYSSIAHMGLMATALFAETHSGFQGIMIQMFNHGINIIGLWIVVELIERKFGTRRMSQLGGLATKAPALAILLVVVALANIALPLTNGFIGEFLMFNGIWSSTVTKYNVVFTVVAAVSIILAAAYMLNMLRRVLFGPVTEITGNAGDIRVVEQVSLGIIVAMIVLIGVYPQPVLSFTESFISSFLEDISITSQLTR